ncbi:ABC transporter permease [Armatimonas sp.]|uniref:ABC transporter permease n=1 Tax=Armatimonas sp. TaxID=1872638 RepID=UPI00286D60DB|nr:ABC transporter permease [Armatimonas sp.]
MLRRKLVIWGALSHATVLESVRRKDLYVAMILSFLMIGMAALVGRFGVQGLDIFLKSATLTVINLLSVILAVVFSARQLPEEISRRTIYPLLARPISRTDLLIGKFLGVFCLAGLGLLVFGLIGWGTLSVYGMHPGVIFWQYLALRLFVLMLLCAVTVTTSVFLTPQATVTITLLMAVGSQAFSQSTLLLDKTSDGFGQVLIRGLYFVIPELNLFDLSGKVSHGWNPVPFWVLAALFGYALIHTLVALSVGAVRFRKVAL